MGQRYMLLILYWKYHVRRYRDDFKSQGNARFFAHQFKMQPWRTWRFLFIIAT